MTKSPAKNHFLKNLLKILFFCFLAVSLGSCSGGGGGESSPTPSTTYWAKTYGGANDDVAYSIHQTSDGGFIVAGGTHSFTTVNGDVWVLKLDANGNIQWQKTYGGNGVDVARSIQQTSDGGFIVAGETSSFATNTDVWILKLDANGNISWQKTYGGNEVDVAYSIQQTSDGGFIVAGETSSFGSGYKDIWILKLNASGGIQWQKTYGEDATDDSAYSVQQTSDGGFIVAGETILTNVGEFWVLKLDANGVIQWQKKYGGTNADVANSIRQTSDGGYIVAGGTSSFTHFFGDIWLLKLDSAGAIQWEKTYGGSVSNAANSIRQTSDGGYIAAGVTNSFGAGTQDFWVLKMDGNGNIGSGCSVIGTSSATVSSTGITAVDSSGTVNNTNATVTQTSVTPQDSTALIATQCSSP